MHLRALPQPGVRRSHRTASRRSAKRQGSGPGHVLPCGTLVQKLEAKWVSSASCCLESQKPSVPKGALGVADGNGAIPVTTCLTAPIPILLEHSTRFLLESND